MDALRTTGELMHRQYIIGGASIYAEALRLQNDKGEPVVDRILFTRILSPAFEECNVYFPDIHNTSSTSSWRQSSQMEIVMWLGFEPPEGVIKENGVEFEYQMWTRTANPAAGNK
jgi:dihydrofolate reductase